MDKEQAIAAAATPIQPANGTDREAYAIPFEYGESIRGLIGKKLINPNQPTATLTVDRWIGQNMVLRINDTDNYSVSPAMWIMNNLMAGKIQAV